MQSIQAHIDKDHVEFSLLDYIANNQVDMSKNFEKFKGELTSVLNTIIDDQNVIKQEIFISRQTKHDDSKKIDNIESLVVKLSKKIEETVATAITNPKTSKSDKTSNTATSSEEKIPKKSTACIIGDSISASLDKKVIANVLKKK